MVLMPPRQQRDRGEAVGELLDRRRISPVVERAIMRVGCARHDEDEDSRRDQGLHGFPKQRAGKHRKAGTYRPAPLRAGEQAGTLQMISGA
jgi:hypothetical protein